jgi:transcriptional regulator with XRE-family HTH domain
MSQEKDEVRRLLDVLQTLMRMLAISNREVERRLDLKHGTVSRLLNGQIEAKLEVVMGVARALGLEYEELFSFAYPERPVPKPESEAARKIRSMLEDLRPMGATAKLDLAGSLDRGERLQDFKMSVREILEEIEKDRQKAGNGSK